MSYFATGPFNAAFEAMEHAGLPHAKPGEVFTGDDALELAEKIAAKYGLLFSLSRDAGQWRAKLRCPASYTLKPVLGYWASRNESAVAAIVHVATFAAQFYSPKAA